MTPERKKILRYGVALDAVILVTGVALNFPDISTFWVVVMFAGAVGLGAWRGGWRPALAALALAFLCALVFFHAAVSTGPTLALLALGGLGGAWAGASVFRRSSGIEALVDALPLEPHTDDIYEPLTAANDFEAVSEPQEDPDLPDLRETKNQKAVIGWPGSTESAGAVDAIRAADAVAEADGGGARHVTESGEAAVSPETHDEHYASTSDSSAAGDIAESVTPPVEFPSLALVPDVSDEEEPVSASDQSVAAPFEAELVADLVEFPSAPHDQRLEDEQMRRLLEERLAANRALIEESIRERVEREAESDRARLELLAAEQVAADRRRAEREYEERLTRERAAIQKRLSEQLATERAAMEREAAERLEEEKRAAQESIDRRFDRDRAALTSPGTVALPVAFEEPEELPDWTAPESPVHRVEEYPAGPTGSDFSDESESVSTHTPPPPFVPDSQTIMTARGPIPKRPLSRTPSGRQSRGLLGSLWNGATSLFSRKSVIRTGVNLRPSAPLLTPPPAAAKRPVPVEPRRPRLLLVERRRAMADTVLPQLRAGGVEAQVVERWIDAVDEMFRFRPDALLVDVEIPDYERLLESLTGLSSALPVFLTGRSRPPAADMERIANAGFLTRPYNAADVVRAAEGLSKRTKSPVRRSAVPLPTVDPDDDSDEQDARVSSFSAQPPSEMERQASPIAVFESAFPVEENFEGDTSTMRPPADAYYIVECFNCSGIHDATKAEWCSCLTKERSLVCTNCLSCFCKAPPSYKEKFWLEAPTRLFERKTAELRRLQHAPSANPSPDYVARPLVLLVEDDEDIQVIVQRVATKLGYGFIAASNGQDGLSLARLYKPDLILSDAFMPKLDGREMCLILRGEPGFENCRMVVITGLYIDTKYKSEALKRFKVDEYIAKPVAINELIALFQRHLEGKPVSAATTPPPPPEILNVGPHGIINDLDEWPEESIALSDLMADNVDREEEVGFEIIESPAAEFLHEETSELEPVLELGTGEELRDPAAAESFVPAVVAAPESEVGSEARDVPDPEKTTYEVCCFSCAEMFDAAHAEWCNCLGRDQTLVCPECGNCFCKAPSLYKERFWMDAPSTLFERKTLGSRRSSNARENPPPDAIKRPLILLVEDDENIQLIVRTVVTTLGYGFIVAADGHEGLTLARSYKPDLVLSDAFMPKLDGREMCRLLKADPATAHAKTIIMTGLYTDRKYRNEAFAHFKVDDYVAKPLAVDDLMRLLRKHLPAEVQQAM